MIRINLIGKKKRVKIKPIHIEVIAFVLAIGLVVAAAVLVEMNMRAKISFMNEEVDKQKRKLQQLKTIRTQVAQFQKQSKTLQNKIDIVMRLKEGQKGYYRILTNLEKALPGDVWLRDISYDNGKIKMNCSSLKVISVNEFISNLSDTGMFHGIDLQVAQKRTSDSITVNSFEIQADVTLEQ